MYDQDVSRRKTILHNVFLLIEYFYWVTFSLFALAAFTIVVVLTLSPGWSVFAFACPLVIACLGIKPKNLAKETVPLILAEMRIQRDPFSLDEYEDEQEMDENPLELGYHPMQLVQ